MTTSGKSGEGRGISEKRRLELTDRVDARGFDDNKFSMYLMQTICLLEKKQWYFSGRRTDDFEGVCGFDTITWYSSC